MIIYLILWRREMKDNIFTKALKMSCYAYTAVFLCIYAVVGMIDIHRNWGIFPLMALSIYALCFFEALGAVLLSKYAKNGVVKYLVHLALTVTLTAMLFRLVNGLAPSVIFWVEIVIAILHLIAFLIISHIAKAKALNEVYENVYRKQNGKK